MVKIGRPVSNETKKTSINIRVTDEERKQLKLLATKEGLNLSEYVIKCSLKEK